MDFLKKHAEKVLLAVLLAALGISGVLVFHSVAALGGKGAERPTPREPDIGRKTDQAEGLLVALTTNPPALDVVTNVFTSAHRKICINPDDQAFLPVDAMVCPFCGAEQTRAPVDTDGDGIPDSLELRWGLNPSDPLDARRDLDGDGFPTLQEYQQETDPIDAASHPALLAYLRLDGVLEKRMLLELRGVAQISDKGHTLQLRWMYPGENRWESAFVRTGQTFGRNNEFTAASFTERFVSRDGRRIDESFATIRHGSAAIELRREGEGRSGAIVESSAKLTLIHGPAWSQDVRIGHVFELDKISYKVIDIRRDAVVIQSGSDDPLTVRASKPEELEALKGPTEDRSSVSAPGDILQLISEP